MVAEKQTNTNSHVSRTLRITMKRTSSIKHDYRTYHGRPKRDRGKNHVSVGSSKRKIKTPRR